MTSSQSRSSTPPASSAALGLELQKIAVRSADLKSGASFKLIPNGDKVAGQVTLDGCGYTFSSEKKRVARRQYGLYDPSGHPTGISNEVVAYDNTSDAALALSEWRAATAKCPHTPQHSSVAGTPDLTYKVLSRVTNSIALPVETSETSLLSASTQGQTIYLYAIFQQRGRFLDAVYLSEDTSPTASDKTNAGDLAIYTGDRLSSLPE